MGVKFIPIFLLVTIVGQILASAGLKPTDWQCYAIMVCLFIGIFYGDRSSQNTLLEMMSSKTRKAFKKDIGKTEPE